MARYRLGDVSGKARARAAEWRVGDVVIRRVDELVRVVPLDTVVHRASPGVEDMALLSHHVFGIMVSGRRILVDTGIGNNKSRKQEYWNNLRAPFLRRLVDAGFTLPSVDLVLCTHLHADHVGWNTTLVGDDWVPTFPNAVYLVPTAEYDRVLAAGGDREPYFIDSVLPIVKSGQMRTVDVPDPGLVVGPGIRLLPSPGHTPGHVSVEITSGGRAALISGDFLHHPVQIEHPEWNNDLCRDPDQAVATRRALLGRLADTDTLLLGSHFPPPTAGRVRRDGTGFRFEP